jgi:zinc protease
MKFMRSVLAFAWFLLATPVLAQTTPPAKETTIPDTVRKAWGFDKSDIKPDPDAIYGVLPNGMRYVVKQNSTPKHAASLRMRFDMGSTSDLPGQEGGAHFLEHMAFNGSKRVPEGEMIKLLERSGLSFGADTNAYTSFGETVYMLELPQVTPQLIDTSLMLMRETAGELTISPAAVERERGIILGEMRARENFGLRQFKDQIQFLVPGAPIARSLPIGTEASIKAVTHGGLRKLYDSYYTPERTTLIFVGDTDPAAMEKQIIAKFGNWRGKTKTSGDPMAATISTSRPFATRMFVDPDVPTTASITVVSPLRTDPDSEARREVSIKEGLGSAILGRRLDALTRKADAKFTGANASISDLISTAQSASVTVIAKDRDWSSALTVAEQELRRALTHGFTQAEVNEQVANVATALKNGADQAATRPSATLAVGFVTAIEGGKIVSTPAANLARFEAIKPRLTADAITAAFRSAWTAAKPLVFVAHDKAEPNGEQKLVAVFNDSAKVAVAAPSASVTAAFAHSDYGPAGKVVSDSRIADLDIRAVRFANNVRLNIKKTDFEKGQIRIGVRVGGGLLEFPQNPDGLNILMDAVFTAGGTTKHSADELDTILAGRAVSGGLNASIDSFSAYRTTTSKDLDLQLQLTAAFMTAPGYRPEAEAQWRNVVGAYLPTFDSTPGGVVARDLARIVANGDKRFGIGNEAALKSASFAQLKSVITPALTNGPIEIGIVGDVDEAVAIAAVAKTFGALPPRMAEFPSYAAGRDVKFAASRAPITLTHSGKPDQGLAMTIWPTTDDSNHQQEVTMSLLAEVIQLQVTDVLREKMGATYSPTVSSQMWSQFKGFGQLTVSSTAEPGKVDEIFKAVDTIAAGLATKAPSADLITRARNPMLERIERNRRENGYWMGIVDEAQSMPRDLRYPRDQERLLRAVTAADLQAAAKLFLKPTSELRVRVVPKTEIAK